MSNLVLRRRDCEGIRIGENIDLVFRIVKNGQQNGIKVVIDAPKDVQIVRFELLDETKKPNRTIQG